MNEDIENVVLIVKWVKKKTTQILYLCDDVTQTLRDEQRGDYHFSCVPLNVSCVSCLTPKGMLFSNARTQIYRDKQNYDHR